MDEAAGQPLRESQARNPLLTTKVHGLCRLPEGYELVIVHRHATCVDDEIKIKTPPPPAPWRRRLSRKLNGMLHPEPQATVSLSSSYNFIKAIISIVQLGLTISTLYRARGDQLDRYGYAAFGLTVSPYAWMSLVNMFGNLMCPQYDSVFVVGSDGLDHLERRLAAGDEDRRRFGVTGLVGRLDRVSDQRLQALRRERRAFNRAFNRHFGLDRAFDVAGTREFYIVTAYQLKRWLASMGWLDADRAPPRLEMDILTVDQGPKLMLLAAYTWAAVVPVVLVGALSLFQPGRSTVSERVWTMMWLVFGVLGVIVESPAVRLEGRPVIGGAGARGMELGVVYTVLIFMYGIASIVGLVAVGNMIMEFGVCERL
ncbi:hypothetical protein MAPG_10308 [Magnaporthiopsis poae ATCC 64411]|uniref:Uncharacterized protein n=1 Tax=Magnaporthiopsis poae (strain ATCC 64411 / 73-15) TaxID=644358 RepID=A0A0C4EC94_MAGP6|nr:hypothetical protein MAPG_10308 [Magnaporthiopsis poae ATCC 64411]